MSYNEKIIGKKFNRLTVLDFAYKNNHNYYECLCNCGSIKIIRQDSIISGQTKSCGCLRQQLDRSGYGKKNFKGLNDISASYFCNLKFSAKNRNIHFDISLQDIWNQYLLQNKKCVLSGIAIKFSPGFGTESLMSQTASVDRIDSKKEYTKDNIQVIHKNIQSIKWHLSEKDLLYFINLVINPVSNNISNVQAIQIKNKHALYKGCGNLSGRKYSQIIYSAKMRDIVFSISIEDCWNLFVKQGGKCSITNLPIRFQTNTRLYDGTASLDRINSDLGYTIDNVQWIHKTINNMKHTYSMDKFKQICQQIYDYRIKGQQNI